MAPVDFGGDPWTHEYVINFSYTDPEYADLALVDQVVAETRFVIENK